jgi:flagellar motor protein MotB
MNVAMKSSHPTHASVKAVKMDVADPDVKVDSRPDGSVLVRVAGTAAFDAGSAKLTKRGKEALKKVGDELKQPIGGAIAPPISVRVLANLVLG